MTRSVLLCVLVFSVVAGCAANRTVVLAPGPIPLDALGAREEGSSAWSLWVRDSRDVRSAEKAGQRMGTLYSRFEKKPQEAFLASPPEVYVREQLGRFLLDRGLEASSLHKARALLDVEIEEFSLEEDPGSLWDEVTVKVGYTVVVSRLDGTEIGRVRLDGQAQVKSPVSIEEKITEALRDAVADTFKALGKSRVFVNLLEELGG